jgi:hypothetical protein
MRTSKRRKIVVFEGRGGGSGASNRRGSSPEFEVLSQGMGEEGGTKDSDGEEGDEECNDEEDQERGGGGGDHGEKVNIVRIENFLC